MKTMDEITRLMNDYRSAEFRAGGAVKSGSSERYAACKEADEKRASLLQAVESVVRNGDADQHTAADMLRRLAALQDRYDELEGANLLNRNAVRLQKERADRAESALAALRAALLGMAAKWHACNEGRAPTEAENERRKCARELERFARALVLAPHATTPDAMREALAPVMRRVDKYLPTDAGIDEEDPYTVMVLGSEVKALRRVFAPAPPAALRTPEDKEDPTP